MSKAILLLGTCLGSIFFFKVSILYSIFLADEKVLVNNKCFY